MSANVRFCDNADERLTNVRTPISNSIQSLPFVNVLAAMRDVPEACSGSHIAHDQVEQQPFG
jgi:hypothetical protein